MSERIALITGALGGIGRATVKAFQAEGWKVVQTDIEEPDTTNSADFTPCDLGSPSQIERLFNTVRRRYGQLDALINNAALQICKPLADMSVAEWDDIQAVNLRAPFLCMREALRLLEANRGSVVNVSSVHAVATSKDIAAYAASKGGLTALTRAAALEFAAHEVRVNAVLPGAVDTEMLAKGLSRGHADGGDLTERYEAFRQIHPMKRVAKPEEISQAILFLADSERSSYITGESLVVDGAVTARLSTE